MEHFLNCHSRRQQNGNKYSTYLKKNTFTKIPFEGCAVEGSQTNTFLEGARAQYSTS